MAAKKSIRVIKPVIKSVLKFALIIGLIVSFGFAAVQISALAFSVANLENKVDNPNQVIAEETPATEKLFVGAEAKPQNQEKRQADPVNQLNNQGGVLAFERDNFGYPQIFTIDNPYLSSQFGQITVLERDSEPQFSPDGKKILFLSARDAEFFGPDADLYTMDPNGFNPVRLTTGGSYESEFSWSPDAAQILFVRGEQIFKINRDGTNETLLASDVSSQSFPVFSPNGDYIFYYFNNSIWRMNPDGSNQTELVLNVQTPAAKVSFTADGTEFVYANGLSLWRTDFTSGIVTEIINTNYDLSAPQFSPDGARIVVLCYNGGATQICRVDADGLNFTQITDSSSSFVNYDNPAWSPDSAKIAFTSLEDLVQTKNSAKSKSRKTSAAETSAARRERARKAHEAAPNRFPPVKNSDSLNGGQEVGSSRYKLYFHTVDGNFLQEILNETGDYNAFRNLSWQPKIVDSPPAHGVKMNFPNPVSGGRIGQGQIRLAEAPQTGDVTINLQSLAPTIFTVPATVTVPQNSIDATFPIVSTVATTFRSGEIAATLNGETVRATISVAPSAPDLAISNLVAPATVNILEGFTASWTVTNNGEAAAPAGQTREDRVYLSVDDQLSFGEDWLLASKFESNAAIQPGASRDVSLSNIIIPRELVPADANFYLIVYAGYNVNERFGNFEDNRVPRVIRVERKLPDIVAENIVLPQEIEPRQPFTLNWSVKNIGSRPSSGSLIHRAYLSFDQIIGNADDIEISAQTAPALAAGQSINYSREYTIQTLPARASANAVAYVKVDTNNQVYESEPDQPAEQNNTASQAFRFEYRVPDLTVQTVSPPPEVETDTVFPLGWTTVNAGNKTAQAFTEQVYFSPDSVVGGDLLLGTFDYPNPLAPNETINRIQNVSIPTSAITATGNYFVYVKTDIGSSNDEGANEVNNTKFQPVNVRRLLRPDLTVTNITAPAAAFFDQTIQVQWTVTNNGQGPTNAAQWTDTLYLGPNPTISGATTLTGARSVSAVNPGESYIASATVKIPRGFNGAYNFFVQTDSGRNLNEENTSNNLLSRPIQINVPPLPDHTVESVRAAAEGFAGAEIDISYTIKNQGTRTADQSSRERLYLSRDTTFDFSDKLFFTGDLFGGIGVNETSIRTAQNRNNTVPATFNRARLPSDVEGLWYVFVVTDSDNSIYEFTNENNNNNYDRAQPGSPLRILITPPDLIVVNQPTAPATARGGQSLQTAFTIKNQGAFNANGNWRDAIYLSADQIFNPESDTLLGSMAKDNLAAGADYTANLNVTVPTCLPNGTYYLFAVADYDKRLTEFDPNFDAEINNASLPKAIELNSVPPDLTIGNLSFAPVTAPGQTVAVSWTTTNQSAGETVAARWYDSISLVSNSGLGTQQLAVVERTGALAANQSYTQTRSIRLPSYMQGEYYFSIVADEYQNVAECAASEQNNRANSAAFSVANNLPDLVIDTVTNPNSAVIGESFNVAYSGRNQNAAMTATNPPPSWFDLVYLSSDTTLSNDDTVIASQFNDAALANNQTYQRQLTARAGNVPAGSYHLLFVADASRNIDEGINNSPTETNNVKVSQAMTLTAPAVDLQVSNVAVTTPTFSGVNNTISWTVTNTGTQPTLGAYWTDYVILSRDSILDASDTFLTFYSRTEILAAGASYQASKNVLLPVGLTGGYTIFVIADRSNYIVENNNDNNTSAAFAINLQLPPPADLNVTNVAAPNAINLGETATFVWTVQNSGPNQVSGSWRDTLYLSRDGFWDSSDILIGKTESNPNEVIAANQTYTRTAQIAAPPVDEGVYYVIVRTDAQNRIRETNEGNNVRASVGTANVQVTQLQINAPFLTTLAQGQEKFFKFDAAPLETLLLSLSSDNQTADNELLTNFGSMVSRADYDFQSLRPGEANQENVIPQTAAGTYYSQVSHDFVPASFARDFGRSPADKLDGKSAQASADAQNIQLEAKILPFSIRKISPETAGNLGYSTIIVEGAKFQTNATVKLVAANNSVLAPVQAKVAASKIAAIFDLKNAAPGDYDVIVTNPNNHATASATKFKIVRGGGYALRETITGPSALRPVVGSARYTFTTANDGLNDAVNVPVVIEIPKTHSFEIDRSNIIDIPVAALQADAVLSDIPFAYDIGDRRIIFLVLPILRSKTSIDININLSFPAFSGGFPVSMIALPPLADLFDAAEPAASLNNLNRRNLARMLDGNPAQAAFDCWKEFARAVVFAVIGELIGRSKGLDNCIKALLSIASVPADLISGAVLGEMTGNQTSGSGAALQGIGKILSLASSVDELAAVSGCVVGTIKVAVPWLRAISITLTIAQLTLQLADCLDKERLILIINRVASVDPNEKIGPAGFGAEKFVPIKQPMFYRINFENLASASAPAQRIFVSDVLPPTLDPRTVRLKEIGFKQNLVTVPDNASFYQTRMQLGADSNNLQADVSAGLDLVNRRVTWTLTAIDPATGEAPLDANVGLLLPNNSNRDGEGFVTFTVEPTATAATRTVISNSATIIFDDNEPIVTNATANLLDSGIPTSQCAMLPATSETPYFPISYAGSDDTNGSGLQGYDLMYSENGKPYVPLFANTTETNQIFNGKPGRNYKFYSLARDNAGNVEAAPDTPDAEITVLGGAFEGDVAPRPNGNNDGQVTVGDVIQIRRFVAGLDGNLLYNEFQRADTAPLSTNGNGAFSVGDTIQARRFAAGLDPIQEAAGALTFDSLLKFGAENSSAESLKTVANAAPRDVRPIRVSRADNKITVGVELQAVGDEAGVGFTLNFDKNVLSNPSNIQAGETAAGASLTVNTDQAATLGRIGITLDKDPRQPFPAGAVRLVNITFDVAANAPATTALSFGNTPVASEAVNGNGISVNANFASARISLSQATAANVSISGRVLTHDGTRGVTRARVTLTDQNGTARSVLANRFGAYRFDNVAAGSTYIFNVSAKHYEFVPVALTISADMTDLDFTAQPPPSSSPDSHTDN